MIANGIGTMVAVVLAVLALNFIATKDPPWMVRFGYGLGASALLIVGLLFVGFFQTIAGHMP